MGPPRSKKRKPTFRRLLKTSGLKLENKLKNRTAKQQNVAKKQRKETKKLRQAVKDASIRTPKPLETYRQNPDNETEEDFLDSLPTDMLEDEDQLKQMAAMARRASFITRDLSACGSVHNEKQSKKRGSSEIMKDYEKVPRKMKNKMADKEVIHLLPIKDKRGVIPQSFERDIIKKPEEEEEEEAAEEEMENETETEHQSLSPEEIETLRMEKIQQKKLVIAALGSAVMADPHSNIKRVKELRGMLMESDPSVAVTVRKLVMVSLMEIFKDIVPSYRIRPLTSEEKAAKVKKETQKLREFEEGLVSQYKFYLEDLEQTVKDWKQQKSKKSQSVSVSSYEGLASVAIRCLCELMLTLPHFNFHNNIIVVLVPLMNHTHTKVSEMCRDAFRSLFHQDREGSASLAAVRVISGLVKSLNYHVKPELLKTLLSLRIKEVQMKKDLEENVPKKKFMNYKEKRKSLSRMQRKWKKAEEMLEKELLEAEASESKEKKLKLHTETLNIVFLIYFRILKKAQKSVLVPAVLEGLANFAHLINLEFFDDLLNVLQVLIQSGDLSNKESLHCIQTVFTILSGQGDVLTIDPLNFYTHLYKMLPRLHAGCNDDIMIALRCLDAMLTRRRKQVTLQRAMAFMKRLSALSLHCLPNASVALLANNRTTLHLFPKADFLLDNEVQGSGFYLPELDQPEHCNSQNSALWELCSLQKHYHPVVRRLANHLAAGAPSEGRGALGAELSRRSPVELFNIYSVRDMSFNPPVAPPPHGKKERFPVGPFSLFDVDLQKKAENALKEEEEEEKLDFTVTHTQ